MAMRALCTTRRGSRSGRGCRAVSGRVRGARWGLPRAAVPVGAHDPARWRVRVLCGALVLAGATACSSAPVVVPVPTFPSAEPSASATAAARETGRLLPADCEELLGHDELTALLGLPLGSVAVRTVQGVPSPSVGRLERMTCTYTVSPGAPPPQGVVLEMVAGAYRDVGSARDQHERNVAVQQGGELSPARPELGSAAAALVHRDAEDVLLTSSDAITLDLTLADRPAPLPPADLLVDLARRVLARLVPDQAEAAPGPLSP